MSAPDRGAAGVVPVAHHRRRLVYGESCAECARQIDPIVWHDRPPALLGPDGSTREWKEVAPEELPELFRTHRPLCWSCHNITAFQREFPGLAFERPGASPIIARND